MTVKTRGSGGGVIMVGGKVSGECICCQHDHGTISDSIWCDDFSPWTKTNVGCLDVIPDGETASDVMMDFPSPPVVGDPSYFSIGQCVLDLYGSFSVESWALSTFPAAASPLVTYVIKQDNFEFGVIAAGTYPIYFAKAKDFCGDWHEIQLPSSPGLVSGYGHWVKISAAWDYATRTITLTWHDLDTGDSESNTVSFGSSREPYPCCTSYSIIGNDSSGNQWTALYGVIIG